MHWRSYWYSYSSLFWNLKSFCRGIHSHSLSFHTKPRLQTRFDGRCWNDRGWGEHQSRQPLCGRKALCLKHTLSYLHDSVSGVCIFLLRMFSSTAGIVGNLFYPGAWNQTDENWNEISFTRIPTLPSLSENAQQRANSKIGDSKKVVMPPLHPKWQRNHDRTCNCSFTT
jgi:hypothetical protein